MLENCNFEVHPFKIAFNLLGPSKLKLCWAFHLLQNSPCSKVFLISLCFFEIRDIRSLINFQYFLILWSTTEY